MSSYVLFQLVKGLVLLLIVCAYVLIERWHKSHPNSSALHN